MIKGHTKIELTNVKTGQKKVIEDTNMVTNGMAKMFETMPHCQLNIPYCFSNSAPLIDKLCGGILLFSDPIEENPDNYLTPSDNIMVGNGRVNYASANDVPEFGAYNAEESSWNPETGERKYVYDFSTSKGNGTISCVALTNFLLGYYGLGNLSGKKESMTVDGSDYTNTRLLIDKFWKGCVGFPNSSSLYNDYGLDTPFMLFADYNKNCIYVIDNYAFIHSSSYANKHISTGTLPIYKIYLPMSSINPMRTLGSDFTWEIIGKIDMEVPSEIKNISTSLTHYSSICRDKDAMYIVFNPTNGGTNIQANATFYVWKISYDLKTSEVITLTNTTGVTIRIGRRSETASDSNSHPMFITDGYLLCHEAQNNRLFKMNLSDPTDVTEFTNLLNAFNKNYGYKFYKLGNTIMVWHRSDGSGVYGAVNLKTNTIVPVNGKPALLYNCNYPYDQTNIPIYGIDDNFVILSCGEKLHNNYNTIALNPFRLSTINNLPEPVVKTSDLSMKITYTLTITDEEEGDS